MEWTGGRATSGGERWTHTRGKQKHSFSSAYRTLPYQHTHYQCKELKPPHRPLGSPSHSHSVLSPQPFPLLLTSPSPILPTLPTHLTILSQLVRELLIISVRANLKLLSPPTIKNQAGCRKGRGSEEEGGKGVSFAAIVCSFYHKLESNSQLLHIPPPLSQAPSDLLLCPCPTLLRPLCSSHHKLPSAKCR